MRVQADGSGLGTLEAQQVRDKLNAYSASLTPVMGGGSLPGVLSSAAGGTSPTKEVNPLGLLLRPPPAVSSPNSTSPTKYASSRAEGSSQAPRRVLTSTVIVPGSSRAGRRSFGSVSPNPGLPLGATTPAPGASSPGAADGDVGAATLMFPQSGVATRFRGNKSGLELLEREAQVGRTAKEKKALPSANFNMSQVNAFIMATPEMLAALSKDAQLKRFCTKLKLEMPENFAWQRTFSKLLDQLPVAAILVNMMIPGLPIAYANAAAAELTGYAVDEMVGR